MVKSRSLKLVQCLVAVSLLILAQDSVLAVQTPAKVTFDEHIKPLLNQRCGSCHNSNRREGDLDVTNYINLMQGGGSGVVVESGDVENSYLYALVTHQDSPKMPPGGQKIPAGEIQLLSAWIQGGLLENVNSKAAKGKPKINMALTAAPTARPNVSPTPQKLPLQPVVVHPVASVMALASNPWAPVLAVSTPGQILLYHTQRLELIGVLENPMPNGHALTFSRNGKFLIVGGGRDGQSGAALLLDAVTGKRIGQFETDRDVALTIDLAPNQTEFAFGGPTKLVGLFDIQANSQQQLKRHTGWVTAVGYSPDGKLLATADRNGGLFIWEADSGVFVQKLDGHGQMVTGLCWRSDSRFLLTGSEDGTVKVWNPEQAKPVKSWAAHGGGCWVAGYRRDGTIFSAGRDRLVKHWQADGKAIQTFKGLQDIVVAAAVCDEQNRFFAADWQGNLMVWNQQNEKPVKTLVANPPPLAQRLAKYRRLVKTAQDGLADTQRAQETTIAELEKRQAELAALENDLPEALPVPNVLREKIAALRSKSTEHESALAKRQRRLERTSAELERWTREFDFWQKQAKPNE